MAQIMNNTSNTKFITSDDISSLPNYKKILPNDPKYGDYTHCSHAMIYAKTKSKALACYDRVALVLMQMRFDGMIGFPGGGVGAGESPVEAVNREIREEAGWVESDGPVTESHHQFTHVDEENKLVLHFYAVEVSEPKIAEIELNSFQASDYGEEVLGNFRVPLYTMKDSFRGFPAFLTNRFVGNAKSQLLETLVNLNILSAKNVTEALTLNEHPNL